MTSPNSRRSRRVMPPVMVSLITELSCDAASRGLSARPPAPLRFRLPKQIDKSMGTASPTPAPESARQAPPGRNFLTAELPHADVGTVLSSGQLIGTARTATRCICRLLYLWSHGERNERAFRAASPVPALELAKARENTLIAALPPLPAAQPHHPFCSVPFSPAGTSVCFSSSFFPNSSSISRSFLGMGTPQRPKFSKRERASLLM